MRLGTQGRAGGAGDWKAPAACALLVLLFAAAAPRALCVLLLFVLPGAWVTFAPWLRDLDFGDRFWLGAAVSPVIIVAQFYGLRLLGVPFPVTAWALVALNAPALYLVWRGAGTFSMPRPSLLLVTGLILFIPLAGLLPQLLDPAGRALSGHAWWHADAVYFIANGQLAVEDPDLAGVRLGYAWAGHAYQAVLSWILGEAPAASFIWTNIACLLIVFALVARTVKVLGGGRLARLSSIVWLSFGVNFVGYVVWRSLSVELIWRLFGPAAPVLADLLPLAGDWRFTPWLLYFLFFHQIVIALALIAAMTYVVVEAGPGSAPTGRAVLLSLLAAGVAFIYPLLAPAAAALLGGAALVHMRARGESRRSAVLNALPPAAALLALIIATGFTVSYTARDRVAETLALHSAVAMGRHLALGIIVLLPLLAGLAISGRRVLRGSAAAAVILFLAGGASLICYVLFALPGGGLEYKFIFTAALFLTPFAAVASEPLLARAGRWSDAALVALALVLAAPFAHKLARDGWARDWIPALAPAAERTPRLDTHSFDLKLAAGEPRRALTEAIRTASPAAVVLVARHVDQHLPTLTQRPFYVAPDQAEGSYRGINVDMDHVLLEIRGYDPVLVRSRRDDVLALFEAATDSDRMRAFHSISRMNRPMALILEDRDEPLARWIEASCLGRRLYAGEGRSVWLAEPATGIDARVCPVAVTLVPGA